ncbi:hypothetical protein [Actinoplanes sp. DH11]|uniref:hypothetical protein n=1 Tax=Actinoplanes sp. DH11 TaxID=2857011 RepID=UPI001E60DC50|nr:hypothetical protein [Actinoplanes sp. DH11]
MGVRVSAVTGSDLPEVADFLHRNLNDKVSAEAWARAVDVPWKVDAPNHGFHLRADDGTVVGAYLAFYSDRTVGGRSLRFCNLGAWCVRPEQRFHSLRLLKALLDQGCDVYTDLSPSGNVVPVNTRRGFRFLDTATELVPNLPGPPLPGAGSVTADRAAIARALTGRELQIFQDHADTAAARHLLLTRGDETCYVIFRKDRRKGLPLFASILYVSDPALFRRMFRQVSRHLLLRHGIPATLAEQRIVGGSLPGGRPLANPRRKMVLGDAVADPDVDYLYSELVCLSW